MLRVSLYALALAGGAGLAHATTPRQARAAAVQLLPQTVVVATLPPSGPELEPDPAPAIPAPQPAAPPDPFGHALSGGRIITGATPHRLVLFTFDDGPDRRNTPLLLDRLDAAGIKAVFFLTANRIGGRNLAERQQAAIARDIIARGHMIGSHTLDHQQLPLLTDGDAKAELVGAERIFKRVLGGVPTLFRPPGGARSPRIDALLASRDYTTLLWNLGTGDFQVRSGEQVFDTWRKVFERRQRDHGDQGGVILMHDTYAWSVDAFQMIFSELERRNCELLEAGEELYDVVDDPALFFQERAGSSPSTFAEAAMPDAAVLAERQARLREKTRARCQARASL